MPKGKVYFGYGSSKGAHHGKEGKEGDRLSEEAEWSYSNSTHDVEGKKGMGEGFISLSHTNWCVGSTETQMI